MFGEWTLALPIPIFGWAAILWVRLMKPRVEFCSPSQRAKLDEPTKAWWHIPVRIHQRWWGTSELKDCRIYLEDNGGGASGHKLKMYWGDCLTEPMQETKTLRAGEVNLIPIVTREESGNDNNAYITNAEFFQNRMNWGIPGDRKKRKFKLFVEVGKFKATSKHCYLIRVPRAPSNGQFSLEIEFEGYGTESVSLEHTGNIG